VRLCYCISSFVAFGGILYAMGKVFDCCRFISDALRLVGLCLACSNSVVLVLAATRGVSSQMVSV